MKNLVHFDYGRDGLSFALPPEIAPDNLVVLHAEETPALPDPTAAVRGALENPLGSRSLEEIAKGKDARTACVVVSDATRPVPTRDILPPVLEALQRVGIGARDTTILVATGLHRPSTPRELERMLGRELAGTLHIVDHVAKDDSELVDLGTSRAGSPIKINRHFVDADLRVLTGYVDPHFFAGFAGGRKSVVPGIAGKETILANHSARNIASEGARFGVLDGNPVHEDALDVALRVGVDFTVNVLINSKHEMTRVAAGDLVEVHEKLVGELSGEVFREFDEPFDIVVCGNGGYPLDLNLYQAVKSMAIGELAVKPGGTIVCVNECSDGVGHAQFRELLNAGIGPAEMYEKITSGEIACEDQWEIQILARVLSRARVRFVSTLEPGDLGNIGLVHDSSVEGALAEALKDEGRDARVLVLPNGPARLARVHQSRKRE
ncbi:MAG: nickel-dependent lactate racemase [Promethearchaeota archaeon]